MTKTITRAAAIAAASFTLATVAHAAPPAPEFVAKAGASDKYELASSELVLGSSNAKIKAFAKDMIRDHTKSTAMVKAAAMKSGVHPKPPVMNDEQKSNIAALTGAKGAARDQLYIQQQKASHQQALDLMQDESGTGDKSALKAVAGKIVPVVQHHIEMLNAMPSA